MLVSNVRIEDLDDGCELRAKVSFDTEWVCDGEPFELWYRFPSWCRPYLSEQNGDPFVAAFLPMAMVLHEPLEIEAPVSPRLAGSLWQVQEIYQSWEPAMTEVECRLPLRQAPEPKGDAGVGLFFTMGADSSYSLLRHLGSESRGPCVSHLINVLGFDIYLWERERYPALLAAIEELGQELGLQVLSVSTNLRELSDRVVDWLRRYHGPALASVTLALDGMLRHVYLAASQVYDRLLGRGSHPLLDPLWSTETTQMQHDGLERTRLQKFVYLAKSPRVIRNLRVCSADDTSGIYNCGVCRKCLYATIALNVAQVQDRCETLPDLPDLERLRAMVLPTEIMVRDFRELAEALGTSQQDRDLRAVMDEMLGRNEARLARESRSKQP